MVVIDTAVVVAGIRTRLGAGKAAQRLANEDGVSLNQWIAVAVAEKVGLVETAAEFFKKRAGRAAGGGTDEIPPNRAQDSAGGRRCDPVTF